MSYRFQNFRLFIVFHAIKLYTLINRGAREEVFYFSKKDPYLQVHMDTIGFSAKMLPIIYLNSILNYLNIHMN